MLFNTKCIITKFVKAFWWQTPKIFNSRIKDFRGLSPKGFDKFGNYTFGIKEHIIFPEVSFDRADKVRGLDIIIVIKAINKEHSFALLEKMNFPFIKKGDN